MDRRKTITHEDNVFSPKAKAEEVTTDDVKDSVMCLTFIVFILGWALAHFLSL